MSLEVKLYFVRMKSV